MSFPISLGFTLRWEGGKEEDDAGDPGGRTAYGMTQESFAGWLHADQDVWTATPDQVVSFYRTVWRVTGCQGFDGIDERLGLLMFDACVQHGQPMAVRFLQRALGGLTDDGQFGPKTFDRLHDVYAQTPQVLLDDLVAERKAHYIARALAPGMVKWLHGWLDRVADCQRVADCDVTRLATLVTTAHEDARLPLPLPGIP